MDQDIETLSELEEIGLSEKEIEAIKANAKSLKEKGENIEMVFPIVVKGSSYDKKPHYVGYFRQPNFKIFSKYLVASSQSQAGAMRTLARDCFLDGDKELVDNDSLFLFGLMGQLSKIIEMRSGTLVNL